MGRSSDTMGMSTDSQGMGMSGDSQASCTPCLEGQYKEEWSNVECSACAALDLHSTTFAPGANSSAQCACQTGFEREGEGDLCLCPPGFGFQGNRCVPCAEGDYKESHGNSECRSCRELDPWKTTREEGTAAERGCVCDSGHFWNERLARCAERGSRSPSLAVGTGGDAAAGPRLGGAPTEEAMLDPIDTRSKQQCDPLPPSRRCIDTPRPVLTIACYSRCRASSRATTRPLSGAPPRAPRAPSNRGKQPRPPQYLPLSTHR